MSVMYFSIKYSDNLLKKKHSFIYNRLFCCNHTCYCVGMVSVTSASRYQSRSSMYIRGLIPRNSAAFAEAVPIKVGYVCICMCTYFIIVLFTSLISV